MTIEPCSRANRESWARLRGRLWPELALTEHLEEISALLGRGGSAVAFLARDGDGRAIGFAEATLRHDHVNGCETSPVAFLEGLYVVPGQRRQGVARRLCRAVEAWALEKGCREFASDAAIDNLPSRKTHLGLGFLETERVVYYRKRLPRFEGE